MSMRRHGGPGPRSHRHISSKNYATASRGGYRL